MAQRAGAALATKKLWKSTDRAVAGIIFTIHTKFSRHRERRKRRDVLSRNIVRRRCIVRLDFELPLNLLSSE
jgi:hypothetical protein